MPTTERFLIVVIITALWVLGTVYYYPKVLAGAVYIQESSKHTASLRAVRNTCFIVCFTAWWLIFLINLLMKVAILFRKPPTDD